MKKSQEQKGSFTVEAIIVLPFYILTICFILNFMNIFYTQLAIQEGLNNTAAVMGKYFNIAAVTVGMEDCRKAVDMNDLGTEVKEIITPVKGLIDNAGDIVTVFTQDGFNAASFEKLQDSGEQLNSNFEELKKQFPDMATAKEKVEKLGKQLPAALINGGIELVGSAGVSAVMNKYLTDMKVNQNLLEGTPGNKIRFHLALDCSEGPDENPRFDLVLTAQYTYKDPMFSFFFDSIPMQQSVVVHPWVGGKTEGLRKVFGSE